MLSSLRLTAVLTLGFTAAARAATLTTVPMQGGMVMPMISYNTAADALEVMMPSTVPQLTPLLISHPEDRFDPASPWYGDLDPGAAGMSFSRRYGFVMDIDSDPLPADTEIWIRKTAGPEELLCFRYAATPGTWEPIFGTRGSPASLYWNQMMFHPAFAALPGTNGFEATFEAYLVDTTTGQERPGSATDPMVFTFTNRPDGRPEVMAGLAIAIDWDAAATNYLLEAAEAPDATTWTEVTNTPMAVDGRSMIMLTPGEADGQVFRMRKRSP